MPRSAMPIRITCMWLTRFMVVNSGLRGTSTTRLRKTRFIGHVIHAVENRRRIIEPAIRFPAAQRQRRNEIPARWLAKTKKKVNKNSNEKENVEAKTHAAEFKPVSVAINSVESSQTTSSPLNCIKLIRLLPRRFSTHYATVAGSWGQRR